MTELFLLNLLCSLTNDCLHARVLRIQMLFCDREHAATIRVRGAFQQRLLLVFKAIVWCLLMRLCPFTDTAFAWATAAMALVVVKVK